MIKLRLNFKKPENYAFFCPVTLLHLTLSNPVGYTDRITPAILMGLRSGTLIDVDSMIDINSGKVKEIAQEAISIKEEDASINMEEESNLGTESEPTNKKRNRKVTSQKEETLS